MKDIRYYSDFCLIPDNYSELESRDNADVSAEFLGKRFKNPIILANMESVVNLDVCRKLDKAGYFYIMHRFGYDGSYGVDPAYSELMTYTQSLVKTANDENWNNVSISVGHNELSIKDLEWTYKNNYRVDFITIDVALGYHIQTEKMINKIRDLFGHEVKIIAGNVGGPEGVEALMEWGADAVKAGIGQGKVCTTRLQTGFTSPMAWLINEIDKQGYNIPLIADGGIQEIGDIAKAINLGADMVMCGALFAPCIDSAAKISENGQKEYYGSASFNCKKHSKNIEGTSIRLEANKTILEKMQECNEALASA